MSRIVTHLLLLATLSVNAQAGAYELTRAAGDVSWEDLKHLAFAVGVGMAVFDYKIDEDHCIHFFIDLYEGDEAEEPTESMDVGGECDRGGPHRLTVQWRKVDGELEFYFLRHRTDRRGSGGIGGNRIDISGYGVSSGGGVYGPGAKLKYGEQTVLVKLRYAEFSGLAENGTSKQEWSKRIVVFGELRPNPNGIIGTE